MTEQLTDSLNSISLDTDSMDYQYMLSLQLFTNEQISKIKKSREAFDQRIVNSCRTIKDFVDYIKYERSLLASIKERMKQNNIAVTADHALIALVSDHMKELYTQGLSIFTQNLRFWDEYIKFLQTFKNKEDISSAFDRMLEFHNDKPDIWIRAIQWEFNENFNDERIKSLFLRAQQHVPESQKLYSTCFQIELENKKQFDEVEAIHCAEVIYERSRMQKFTNAEFYIEMLEILDKFSYAQSIEQRILDDMQEMCPHAEIRWHTLAQRALKGLSSNKKCDIDFSGLIKMEYDTDENKKAGDDSIDTKGLNLKRIMIENLAASPNQTHGKRIELCAKIYEDAVKDVNSAKMWNYYVNTMTELYGDSSTQTEIKRCALLKAFAGACEFSHLTEENYIQYIELSYETNPSDENIERIIQKATNSQPRSLPIWLLCMRYYIQQNNFKKVRETFRTSKDSLGKNGVEIWELYMMYVKSCGNPNAKAEFNRFVTDLSRQHHPAYDKLKANILEMLASSAGMKKVREAYELFTRHYPVCDEVHGMMTNLESRQLSTCK